MGVCYSKGSHIECNPVEAAKWYRRAAEKGHHAAQRSLGTCYRYGIGVPIDEEEATLWLDKSAIEGETIQGKEEIDSIISKLVSSLPHHSH